MNILELGSLTRWSEIRKKNRLIDEGVHLNRQTVGLAREEIGRRGNEFMGDIHQSAEMFGDIVRKVSKRSLRSMRSQRSHDSDQGGPVELEDIGPLGPPGAGLEHHHTVLPREVYHERECVMGKSVPEEAEELSSMDGGSDDDYGWSHTQEHSSHMTPKVQPYTGFEKQKLRGSRLSTGDYAIDMDASLGEHASHMEAKIKPADMESGNPAQEFEDVDLGGKSDRRGSKTTKQD